MTMEMIDLIRGFVAIQRQLCVALEREYRPDRFLLTLPKKGTLQLNGEDWEFHRHGTGVCFRKSTDGAEVDVTDHLELPEAFDPWRLATFCRSLSIDQVSHNGLACPTSDQEMRKLFANLLNSGVLLAYPGSERLAMLPRTPDSPRSTPRG
jgi:hypothetical protein